MDDTELVDIRDIKIDPSLPLDEKKRQYLEKIKNPYRFRLGEYPIKATFSKSAKTIEECMSDIF